MTNIKADGMEVIANELKENNSLKELSLFGNPIGDAGAKFLSNLLKENTTITKIGLGDTAIHDAGAANILTAINQNFTIETIEFRLNHIDEDLQEKIQAILNRNIDQSASAALDLLSNLNPEQLYIPQELTSQIVMQCDPATRLALKDGLSKHFLL